MAKLFEKLKLNMAAVSEDAAMCIECEDQEAAVFCQQCNEPFCRPCWQMQHRSGKRTRHETTSLLGELMPLPSGEKAGLEARTPVVTPTPTTTTPSSTSQSSAKGLTETSAEVDEDEDDDGWSEVGGKNKNKGVERVHEHLVPLRLSERERLLLAVLEGALQVSEYTDNVDTLRYGKTQRIITELEEMFQLVAGLLCCLDIKAGTKVVKNFPHFVKSAMFYQDMFEIGRRYKIMNPEKMRSNYGKLMYLLMDTSDSMIQDSLRFDCVGNIQTVGELLKSQGCLGLLTEPDFGVATAQHPSHIPADQRDQLRKNKASAIATLTKKYCTSTFPPADLERVVHSVADSRAYESIACAPIDAMLEYLKKYFSFDSPKERRRDLSLRYGNQGSKLNHSHSTQYNFVLQSLTLWRKISQSMYYLWRCSDEDMLNGSGGYRLANTGQGLQRVQSCPLVSRAMNNILREVQSEVGSWIGLSVVHLGDRDVPNALVFIDKYTQVPRILAPLVQTLDKLDELALDEGINAYFTAEFGSVEDLRLHILKDYFLHGFDGSGDDGGSCIDGRLTSTWNWCSKLEKKKYFRVFLLAGFTGFDGDWRAD